ATHLISKRVLLFCRKRFRSAIDLHCGFEPQFVNVELPVVPHKSDCCFSSHTHLLLYSLTATFMTPPSLHSFSPVPNTAARLPAAQVLLSRPAVIFACLRRPQVRRPGARW